MLPRRCGLKFTSILLPPQEERYFFSFTLPVVKWNAPSGESESEYTNFSDMDGEVGTTSEAGHNGHGQSKARRRLFRVWPGGTKIAKKNIAAAKAQEGAIYVEAQATKTMAEAHMKKVALLEEQNLLMLMTMPDDPMAASKAREYLVLRQIKELKKLQKRMAEEEAKEAKHGKELE